MQRRAYRAAGDQDRSAVAPAVLGTLIGAFLIALIRNGSVLLNINTFYQDVIIGVVIWLAVFWDQYRRRKLGAL